MEHYLPHQINKNPRCPNCLGSHTENFYTVKNAPSQSLITIKSYHEAMSIPKKDISLALCRDCGFIFNSSFDRSIEHYTKGYEDQQGFSPTFTAFLTNVSRRFIEKYKIIDKDIIEIGCGKGDFLSLVCELGHNRGIGIDPAFVPGRIPPNPNLKFIPEFYSDKHGDLPNDMITCRHTLEHISLTDEFLSTVRNSIRNENKAVTLFFEVPNILRILNVQAFWDIFYEHCSYFSPGSLARLFRRNKFEILDLYLEYDQQYLFIEARPADAVSEKVHPLEESPEVMKSTVDQFILKINKHLSTWRDKLIQLKNENKKTVIWGGGSKSVGFLTQFDDLKIIEHVVDINPHMQGNYIPGVGIQYISPEKLREIVPDVIIVMNGIYKNEIKKTLKGMSLYPELICL